MILRAIYACYDKESQEEGFYETYPDSDSWENSVTKRGLNCTIVGFDENRAIVLIDAVRILKHVYLHELYKVRSVENGG